MSGASCGQNPRKRPPRAKYQREALEASASISLRERKVEQKPQRIV